MVFHSLPCIADAESGLSRDCDAGWNDAADQYTILSCKIFDTVHRNCYNLPATSRCWRNCRIRETREMDSQQVGIASGRDVHRHSHRFRPIGGAEQFSVSAPSSRGPSISYSHLPPSAQIFRSIVCDSTPLPVDLLIRYIIRRLTGETDNPLRG